MTTENNAERIRISELIAPTFMEVHRDVRKRGHQEYWLKGGRGSAKSSYVSVELILQIMKTPGMNAIVYRKVAATLRESVYEQTVWAIDRMGLRPWFEFRLSPLEIRYTPTGQRILFRGADDPSKSKSIKLAKGYFGFLWFEELAEFGGPDDIRTIKASIIRGGERTVTMCSYNPPVSARNWVNKAALEQKKNRLVHHSSYLDVPAEWLGEDFIAEAEATKATNERAYRHTYLGEVTGTGGNVFANLEIRKILPEEHERLGSYFNGLDFGFAVDPDAFVRWAYDKRSRKIYAISEFYGPHNSTDRLSEAVKTRANREPVRADSADPRMISELRSRGVQAIGVKKGPGSVEHGMRWLQDLSAIVIDPATCPNIAKEFSAYEYRMNKDGEFLSDYPDKDNHTIDATRYALEPEIGMRKLQTLDKRMLGI